MSQSDSVPNLLAVSLIVPRRFDKSLQLPITGKFHAVDERCNLSLLIWTQVARSILRKQSNVNAIAAWVWQLRWRRYGDSNDADAP
jgi:hypothetical protein